MKKIGFVLLAVFFISYATCLAGEMGSQLAKESIIEKIQKNKVIRVGMSTFVPWAMKDK